MKHEAQSTPETENKLQVKNDGSISFDGDKVQNEWSCTNTIMIVFTEILNYIFNTRESNGVFRQEYIVADNYACCFQLESSR